MSDAYSARAKANIVPLSVGDAFPAVFEEWRVTGRLRDHGLPSATCQLCEQERIRYHYEISNDATLQTLWIGSSCILRFGVPVFKGHHRLRGEKARKHLSVMLADFQKAESLRALRVLAKKENNEILANALDYYEEHGSLSPKFAFVVFWRLKTHRIEHNPAFFAINLRRQRFMRDLESMSRDRVKIIWPALSASQRRRAVESGVDAPDA